MFLPFVNPKIHGWKSSLNFFSINPKIYYLCPLQIYLIFYLRSTLFFSFLAIEPTAGTSILAIRIHVPFEDDLYWLCVLRRFE